MKVILALLFIIAILVLLYAQYTSRYNQDAKGQYDLDNDYGVDDAIGNELEDYEEKSSQLEDD